MEAEVEVIQTHNPGMLGVTERRKRQGMESPIEFWREINPAGLLILDFQPPELFSSVQFSHSVVSDSLRPHGMRYTRPPCLLPTFRVYSNLCPLSQWCHPTISSSMVRFFSCPQSFPASESFPLLYLCIRWPKYWSFSFSIRPSNEYSGLIFFRIDWSDLAV